MKYAYTGIIILIQLIATEQVFGQKDLFSIGGIVGVNFSQLIFEELVPDEQTDHHNGFSTGVFCNADLNDHYNIKMEILYSRNGAYSFPESYPILEYGKINLNYFEVPIHFDYYINSLKMTNSLPDWTFEIGGAYSNLFGYYIEDIHGTNVTEQIVYNYKSSILFQIGTTLYFVDHFGGNIRFSMPMLPFRDELGISTSFKLIYRIGN